MTYDNNNNNNIYKLVQCTPIVYVIIYDYKI